MIKMYILVNFFMQDVLSTGEILLPFVNILSSMNSKFSFEIDVEF